jgi:hypothetical protein
MGKWIHRITEKDMATREGVCTECGPVRLDGNGRCSFSQSRWTNRAVHTKHQMSAEQYDELLRSQDGRCAICRDELTTVHIDHDHRCCPGKHSCGECVRGLLCPRCNLGLGFFRDNLELLNAALQYLNR